MVEILPNKALLNGALLNQALLNGALLKQALQIGALQNGALMKQAALLNNTCIAMRNAVRQSLATKSWPLQLHCPVPVQEGISGISEKISKHYQKASFYGFL